MSIKIKKIKSSKIILSDLKLWIGWLNDKIITKYSDQKYSKHTITSQKKFLKMKIKSGNCILFKIYYKKIFVGVIEIGNIYQNNQNCEIMYFIGNKKYFSKVIATEAIQLALKYVKKIKVKKVYAGVYANNIASIKVLKKNKFKIEGKISNFFNFKLKHKTRISKILLGLNLK